MVPVSALTALQALSDVGRMDAGQRVSVTVPPAEWAVTPSAGEVVRAEVTAVCSTSKLVLVRSLGADHVVD